MAASAAVARENGRLGGRPVGASTRLTRRRADELCEEGETPLDVMVQNMLFWHHHVGEVTKQLRALVIDPEDKEQVAEALKLMREMLASRENSQRCAVDAAPYCHAKFLGISWKAPPKEVTADAIPADAVEAATIYQRLISGT